MTTLGPVLMVRFVGGREVVWVAREVRKECMSEVKVEVKRFMGGLLIVARMTPGATGVMLSVV